MYHQKLTKFSDPRLKSLILAIIYSLRTTALTLYLLLHSLLRVNHVVFILAQHQPVLVAVLRHRLALFIHIFQLWVAANDVGHAFPPGSQKVRNIWNVYYVLLWIQHGFMTFPNHHIQFYLHFTQSPNFFGIGLYLKLISYTQLVNTNTHFR